MNNFVLNKNGVYSYRKSILGKSLCASLQTKNKFEALRVVNKVNSVVELTNLNGPDTVRAIVLAALHKYHSTFKKERLKRVKNLLGISHKSE